MIFLFAIIYICLAAINHRILGTRINSFNLIFIPYVFILIFNNLFMHQSFMPISNEAIFILIASMFVYEFGIILFHGLSRKRLNNITIEKTKVLGIVDISRINYRIVSRFILIVVFVRLAITVYLFYKGGLGAIAGNDYEGMEIDPITGRLVMCLFPAGWIIAFKLFADKELSIKKRVYYVILCVAVLLVHFLGAVKAHAMIYAVGVFLIAIYCSRKNAFRGLILLVGIVLLMFFGNYALSWLTIDNSVPTLRYTLNHFWKYIAGGTINLGGMIADGSTTYGFTDFWIAIVFAIPNEFLSLVGIKITGDGRIPYISVFPKVSYNMGSYYERSNVVNLFGRMYGNGNILGFLVNVIVFALVSEWAMKTYRVSTKASTFIVAVVVLSYEFVSFFAFYYSSTHFWQMIFYSALFTWFVQVRWKLNGYSRIVRIN